jgi:hypothetical protein
MAYEDVETYRPFKGELESEDPRPEVFLSKAQRGKLLELHEEFPDRSFGIIDMGSGYVVARVYGPENEILESKLLYPLGP